MRSKEYQCPKYYIEKGRKSKIRDTWKYKIYVVKISWISTQDEKLSQTIRDGTLISTIKCIWNTLINQKQ